MKLKIFVLSWLLLGLAGATFGSQKGEWPPVETEPSMSQAAPQETDQAGWSLGLGLGAVVGVAVALLTGSITSAGLTVVLLLLSGLLGIAAFALGINALRKKRGPRNLAIGGLISGGLIALFGLGSIVAFLIGFGG
ncbi:MAG: hypothetical protein AAF399_15625 [Bacteroidota bacterium]